MESPNGVYRARVVVQANVKTIECPGGGHVVLAVQFFLGRTAKNLDGSDYIRLFHMRFERNCGANRSRTNQVMTTAMSIGIAAFRRCLRWHGVIAQTRKGVKLHEQPENRGPAAPGGDPRRIAAANPPLLLA